MQISASNASTASVSQPDSARAQALHQPVLDYQYNVPLHRATIGLFKYDDPRLVGAGLFVKFQVTHARREARHLLAALEDGGVLEPERLTSNTRTGLYFVKDATRVHEALQDFALPEEQLSEIVTLLSIVDEETKRFNKVHELERRIARLKKPRNEQACANLERLQEEVALLESVSPLRKKP